MYFSHSWSIAAFIKNAQIVAAGPFIVIETDVFGEHKSKPEYNFLASSKVQIDTPELPILPYISGRMAGSSPYNVTLSKAVDKRFAGKPNDT